MIPFAKSTVFVFACLLAFASTSHGGEFPVSEDQEITAEDSRLVNDFTEFLECAFDMAILHGNVRSMVYRTIVGWEQELVFDGTKGIAGVPAGSGRFSGESRGTRRKSHPPQNTAGK